MSRTKGSFYRTLTSFVLKLSSSALQATLFANLAKASGQLSRFGWVAHYASLALHVMNSLDDEVAVTVMPKRNKCTVDMLVLRAKAFLKTNRPQLASRDCDQLDSLEGGSGSERSRMLRHEIEGFKARRVALNRKLAKNVASWVSMT